MNEYVVPIDVYFEAEDDEAASAIARKIADMIMYCSDVTGATVVETPEVL